MSREGFLHLNLLFSKIFFTKKFSLAVEIRSMFSWAKGRLYFTAGGFKFKAPHLGVLLKGARIRNLYKTHSVAGNCFPDAVVFHLLRNLEVCCGNWKKVEAALCYWRKFLDIFRLRACLLFWVLACFIILTFHVKLKEIYHAKSTFLAVKHIVLCTLSV